MYTSCPLESVMEIVVEKYEFELFTSLLTKTLYGKIQIVLWIP